MTPDLTTGVIQSAVPVLETHSCGDEVEWKEKEPFNEAKSEN